MIVVEKWYSVTKSKKDILSDYENNWVLLVVMDHKVIEKSSNDKYQYLFRESYITK